MRRIFCILSVILIFCASCTVSEDADRLAYQNEKLYIEADVTLNDEYFPVTITLEEPEYDENGRMYARNGVLSIGENSILSGIVFEFQGGKVYVSSGEMKIPIEDEEMISGISDIISLFCISDDFYYSSEKLTVDKLKCENVVFIDGDNRVEVMIDLSCNLPKMITAAVNGRNIAANIGYIKAEAAGTK